MSLKSELSQLHKRYPILTIIATLVFLILLIGPIYEIGKELGRAIYYLIH